MPRRPDRLNVRRYSSRDESQRQETCPLHEPDDYRGFLAILSEGFIERIPCGSSRTP